MIVLVGRKGERLMVEGDEQAKAWESHGYRREKPAKKAPSKRSASSSKSK